MMKRIILASILLLSSNAFSQQQMINETFEYDGYNRYQRIVLPENYTEGMPLVLNLHGYTSNGWQEMIYTGMNETADNNDFVLVYPNGLYDSYGLQFWDSGVDYEEVDDVGYINALIDTMITNYQIDESRVYVCGMSNGGAMAHQLACDLGGRIAAVASVTGTMNTTMYDNCSPERAIPVMQIHGTKDVVFPYYGMTENWIMGTTLPIDGVVAHWVWENWCWSVDSTNLPDIDPTEFSTITKYTYSNCTDNVSVELYKIHGGGHTWPNGFQIPWQPWTNRDINTNQVIWDFFSQYSLPTPTSTEEVATTELIIAPNPMQSETEISSPQLIKSISLFDLSGRKVMEKWSNSYQTTLRASHLPTGVYILEVNTTDALLREKLVIQ